MHHIRYLEELFDNIALNEIKLRDDLSQAVGDMTLADRNWDDLLQVRGLCDWRVAVAIDIDAGQRQ
jgi:hypothetical protein